MSQSSSSSNAKNRVVVIGLDSVDPDLVQLWA